MKKLHFLFLILGILFFTNPALATFSITTDTTNINFGPMDPGNTTGDIPVQGLSVTCTSDQGNQWFLRVYTETPFEHVDSPNITIFNENFYWYGINTDGAGDLVTDEEDMLSEKIVYTSTSTEGANGITITVKFKLEVPQHTQSGEYNSKIIFTLTE